MNTKAKYIKIPDENPTKFNDMPAGLGGYWWETVNKICIPFVENEHEGDGTFSRWLKELEAKHKIIFFPTIISARLDAILRARGYQDAGVNDDQLGCWVDGLAKDCTE